MVSEQRKVVRNGNERDDWWRQGSFNRISKCESYFRKVDEFCQVLVRIFLKSREFLRVALTISDKADRYLKTLTCVRSSQINQDY